MEFFDFNIHLPIKDQGNVNGIIEQDRMLDGKALERNLLHYTPQLQAASGCNFLLFNTQLIDQEESVMGFLEACHSRFKYASTTALIDFRRVDAFEYLEKLRAMDVRCVMVNSYLQQIEESDFSRLVEVYRNAASQGFILCIDGSYGTSKMYTYDNLKLACAVADRVSEKTPIVIVHSGGLRLLEAMLLAEERKNVWLDTSFSLPYYLGSSLEKDFAYAYKKLECRRVVYGSDHPYMDFDLTLEQHQQFFDRHDFSRREQERIFVNNAMELFSF